jgi:predicted glycosyltransferase
VKVLFSALHFANLRIFEPVIRALAERGHTVVLVADERETFGGHALVQALAM